MKQNNILVDGDRFIAADLGSSRLKDHSQSSTLFKKSIVYYISPECEELT